MNKLEIYEKAMGKLFPYKETCTKAKVCHICGKDYEATEDTGFENEYETSACPDHPEVFTRTYN